MAAVPRFSFDSRREKDEVNFFQPLPTQPNPANPMDRGAQSMGSQESDTT